MENKKQLANPYGISENKNDIIRQLQLAKNNLEYSEMAMRSICDQQLIRIQQLEEKLTEEKQKTKELQKKIFNQVKLEPPEKGNRQEIIEVEVDEGQE
jgi:hypothetical protein